MFSKLFSHTPTDQEQQFIDIVDGLLKNPDTKIKVSPIDKVYILSNERNHYYALIKENGIQVTNTKFSFAKSLHHKTFKIIVDNINAVIDLEMEAYETKIFQNETEVLNNVLAKLK
jgi:hypothetical protein